MTVSNELANVTRDDAVNFLEGACRNWSHVPKLSEDDIGDVASELLRFIMKRAELLESRTSQPVAWRLKWGPEGRWYYEENRPADDNPRSPYFGKLSAVEPLFASPPSAQGEAVAVKGLGFFSENVDRWGAIEWFDRLAKAVRAQDDAVVADDDVAFEICRNVAASSAMRLVRDYEQNVRSALSPAPSLAVSDEMVERAAKALVTAKGTSPMTLFQFNVFTGDESFDHEDESGRRFIYSWRKQIDNARAALTAALTTSPEKLK